MDVSAKTATLFVSGLALTGCLLVGDVLYGAGFKGAYMQSGRAVFGEIMFSTGSVEYGRLTIGSSTSEECQGSFGVVKKASSLYGLASRAGVFRGELYCLDGSSGNFEFVSVWPVSGGPDGKVTGQIGDEQFQAEISNGLSSTGRHVGQFGVVWKVTPQSEWNAARELAGNSRTKTN